MIVWRYRDNGLRTSDLFERWPQWALIDKEGSETEKGRHSLMSANWVTVPTRMKLGVSVAHMSQGHPTEGSLAEC